MKRLNKLKEEHHQVEIPSELDSLVNASIRQAKKETQGRKPIRRWVLGLVAAIALFFTSINMSPSFAQAMTRLPGIGSFIELLTVHKMVIDEDGFQADIETAAIVGLDNEALQTMLNEKYIEENQALFKQFTAEMEQMKKEGGGYLGVNTIYEIKTDTPQLFSVARYEIHTQASSATSLTYNTIDKVNQILITLPSLFKDDSYIDIISAYIREEMKAQMATNQNTSYFIGEEIAGDFDKIKENQSFYITNDHKLVISFNEYEVAPGYMGVVKFEIPTDLLKDVLVSNQYIR